MRRRLSVVLVTALLAILPGLASPGLTQDRTVRVRVLAINDFHGMLEPPTGDQGRLDGVPVGGLAYLASHLAALRRDVPHSIVVSAGDNVGATPLVSALFHDEPTIEALGAAGLELSAVGNHELDEGWRELERLQRGGCHPVDGCQDDTPFAGASFSFLTANVFRREPGAPADATLFPAYAVREFDGVRVGFIGLTLHNAPHLLAPASIAGLSFEDEARAANRVVQVLRRQGVRAIVALIHQGIEGGDDGPDACAMSPEIRDIVRRLSPEIDAVISGHTHRPYNCLVRNTLLTSTGAFGRRVTRLDLTIDRRTGQVVERHAENIPVTRDVPPEPAVAAIIDRYRSLAVIEARRPVGEIVAPIPETANPAGESPLGDLVADAMLAAAAESYTGRAVLALMNRGGIRTDLVRSAEDGAAGGTVTYADLFRVLPFGNQVVVRSLSGDALLRLLEQQFDNPVAGRDRILQVSNGLTYEYARNRPPGQRIRRDSLRLHGQPIVATASYRVAMPDFLWEGGDNFTVAREGTAVTPVLADVEVLARYFGAHSPVAVPVPDRIHREDAR